MASASAISAAAMIRGDLQVALRRPAGADADRLVGQFEVRRPAVGLGIDHRDLNPEVAAGPDHPQGDLPPVGDENLR